MINKFIKLRSINRTFGNKDAILKSIKGNICNRKNNNASNVTIFKSNKHNKCNFSTSTIVTRPTMVENNNNQDNNTTTVNNEEVKKFSDASNDWWGFNNNNNNQSNNTDTVGPLHFMNPCRVKYVCRKIKEFQQEQEDCDNNKANNEKQRLLPLSGLKILDVGCGGGILSESLARLGGTVTGLDASLPSIEAARLHSKLNHNTKNIKYVHSSVEDLVLSYDADGFLKDDTNKFDIICALEIIEHVNNPSLFLNECTKLLKEKNGHIFLSTLNRTSLSYFLSIMMAEDVLQMVPSGTHDWSKYIQPNELKEMINKNNNVDEGTSLKLHDIVGMQYNPVLKKWYENDKDLSVNYIAHLGF